MRRTNLQHILDIAKECGVGVEVKKEKVWVVLGSYRHYSDQAWSELSKKIRDLVTAPMTKVMGFYEFLPTPSPYGVEVVTQQTPARVWIRNETLEISGSEGFSRKPG